MFKNAYFLLLASLPTLTYANAQQCCDPLVPPEPIESCQIPVGYFYPAVYTFSSCGFDISLSGEFIYWEVNNDSHAKIGLRTSILDNNLKLEQTDLLHHQGYRPGFKVVAAMGLPGCDAWQLNLEYTWFHQTTTNNFQAPAGGYIAPSPTGAFVFPQLFFVQDQSLKSHLKFDLDFIHATVGRAFYLSKRLIVNASSGLKAWWSSRDQDLLYLGAIDLVIDTKSKVWGIGPYLTANIKGLLWCGVYMYGKAGVWIPYTRYTTLKVQAVAPLIGINTLLKPNKFLFTTQLMYEGGAGLGWGTYLCNCNYHIDLMIGYDMMTNYITAAVVPPGNPHFEFYYQGLSVRAQFDF